MRLLMFLTYNAAPLYTPSRLALLSLFRYTTLSIDDFLSFYFNLRVFRLLSVIFASFAARSAAAISNSEDAVVFLVILGRISRYDPGATYICRRLGGAKPAYFICLVFLLS